MDQIPTDVFINQFVILSIQDLKHLSQTCKRINTVLKDERFWKAKFILNYLDITLVDCDTPSPLPLPSQPQSYYSTYTKTLDPKYLVVNFKLIDLDTQSKTKVEKFRYTILTHEHLKGLVSIMYIYRQYISTFVGLEFDFVFRRVRSNEEKDKEEQLWRERAAVSELEHNRLVQRYLDYMEEFRLNGVTHKLDEIIGSIRYYPYQGFKHPLPSWNFVLGSNLYPTVDFKYYEPKPNREDYFGNLDTLDHMWDKLNYDTVFSSFLETDWDPESRLPDESSLTSIEKLKEYYGLTSIKEYVVCLSFPNGKRWVNMTFSDSNFLDGIKFGCKLLNLDVKEWVPLALRIQISKIDIS